MKDSRSLAFVSSQQDLSSFENLYPSIRPLKPMTGRAESFTRPSMIVDAVIFSFAVRMTEIVKTMHTVEGISDRNAPRTFLYPGAVSSLFITPCERESSIAGVNRTARILSARRKTRLALGEKLFYNSNHIEGSRLSHDQTRYIFETNTIGVVSDNVNVDDIVETSNHFRCIDLVIENAESILTESFIKELHLILKNGTSDSRRSWFAVGDYKKLPNEVGGRETTLPENVADEMKMLITGYNAEKEKTFEQILDFHYHFERIHPFQDGNGRVGRLILFKECLRHNIVPFIIDEELKMFYYRGLSEWSRERGYLTDTCLAAQDKFKKYLDYFKISY